jgi:hypothetical protein
LHSGINLEISGVRYWGRDPHIGEDAWGGWIIVYDGWLCEEGIITVLAVIVGEMNTICIRHGEGLGVVEASIAINVVKVEKLD